MTFFEIIYTLSALLALVFTSASLHAVWKSKERWPRDMSKVSVVMLFAVFFPLVNTLFVLVAIQYIAKYWHTGVNRG